MKKLRKYQRRAVDSAYSFYKEFPEGRNPVIAMPCATGKALIISYLIMEILNKRPNYKVLQISHVKELVEQNCLELLGLQPSFPVGVYASGLKRKEIKQVTFCSIQSVAKIAIQFGHIDLVICDEAHAISSNENTQYRKFLDELLLMNPMLRILGLTASPYRLGEGLITDGDIFTDFCIDATGFDGINWFIDNGYLSNLVTKRTVTQIDLSDVHIRGGEYVAKEVQAASDKQEVTYNAICEIIKYSQGRNCWLIFASGVEHSDHIAEMLNDEFGISAISIHSKMSEEARDKAIIDFKLGKYRCAVNNLVLTVGTNIPQIDLIADLSATTSASRHCQKLGRGMRPVYAEGYDLDTSEGRLSALANGIKPNCLVLDFVGNVTRLGPINDLKVPKKRGEGGSGDAPVKCCPECNALHHTSRRTCDTFNELTGKWCDFVFEFKTKISNHASESEAIARAKPIELTWYDVKSVSYASHKSKKSGNVTLKVTYAAGALSTFSEYINVEGNRFYARTWWTKRQTNRLPELPDTVALALDVTSELLVPMRILVKTGEKYPSIENVDFGET